MIALQQRTGAARAGRYGPNESRARSGGVFCYSKIIDRFASREKLIYPAWMSAPSRPGNREILGSPFGWGRRCGRAVAVYELINSAHAGGEICNVASFFDRGPAPNRPIIELEAALREFGDKPAQGEVASLSALQQPDAVLARNCLRLVRTHLTRHNAAGLTHPDNRRADANAKLRRRLRQDRPRSRRRRNALAKIH
jgi:hypothetical protein